MERRPWRADHLQVIRVRGPKLSPWAGERYPGRGLCSVRAATKSTPTAHGPITTRGCPLQPQAPPRRSRSLRAVESPEPANMTCFTLASSPLMIHQTAHGKNRSHEPRLLTAESTSPARRPPPRRAAGGLRRRTGGHKHPTEEGCRVSGGPVGALLSLATRRELRCSPGVPAASGQRPATSGPRPRCCSAASAQRASGAGCPPQPAGQPVSSPAVTCRPGGRGRSLITFP